LEWIFRNYWISDRPTNRGHRSDVPVFSLTRESAVIKTRALLNILFHPSGTHANGHLDAVFVFSGPVDTRPRLSQLHYTQLHSYHICFLLCHLHGDSHIQPLGRYLAIPVYLVNSFLHVHGVLKELPIIWVIASQCVALGYGPRQPLYAQGVWGLPRQAPSW
jgi:hypothetical protein